MSRTGGGQADCLHLLWLMTCGLIVWRLLISFRLIKDAEGKLQLDKPELPPRISTNSACGNFDIHFFWKHRTNSQQELMYSQMTASFGIGSAEPQACTVVFFCSVQYIFKILTRFPAFCLKTCLAHLWADFAY